MRFLLLPDFFSFQPIFCNCNNFQRVWYLCDPNFSIRLISRCWTRKLVVGNWNIPRPLKGWRGRTKGTFQSTSARVTGGVHLSRRKANWTCSSSLCNTCWVTGLKKGMSSILENMLSNLSLSWSGGIGGVLKQELKLCRQTFSHREQCSWGLCWLSGLSTHQGAIVILRLNASSKWEK